MRQHQNALGRTWIWRVDVYRRLCLMQFSSPNLLRSPARGKQSAHSYANGLMFGPYTPTLLALLTRKPGLLRLPTLKKAAEDASAANKHLCTGKVAVITGAANGIGASLARTCAKYGCTRLVLGDLRWGSDEGDLPADRHPLITDLRTNYGADVLPLTLDVGDRTAILALRDATLERFGAPHFLFNNAGVGMPGILSATEEVIS